MQRHLGTIATAGLFLIALFAVLTGLSNAMTWTSVLVYVLLLAGEVYSLLQGEKNSALSTTLAE